MRMAYLFVFGDQARQVVHLPYLLVEFVQLRLQFLVVLLDLVVLLCQDVVGLLLIVVRLLHYLLQHHLMALQS